jgi:CRISPR/Cas system-associated protein Cas5 (RAMP superfamily)
MTFIEAINNLNTAWKRLSDAIAHSLRIDRLVECLAKKLSKEENQQFHKIYFEHYEYRGLTECPYKLESVGEITGKVIGIKRVGSNGCYDCTHNKDYKKPFYKCEFLEDENGQYVNCNHETQEEH